jgi:hypothetical protein
METSTLIFPHKASGLNKHFQSFTSNAKSLHDGAPHVSVGMMRTAQFCLEAVFLTTAAPPKASADGDVNSQVTYTETAMHP